MSYADCERIAYIKGDLAAAAVYAELQDFEDEVEGFDDQLETVKDIGRCEGMDADTAAEIAELKADREELQTNAVKLKELLGLAIKGMSLTTAKERNDYAKRVRVSAQSLGVWL